MKENVLSLPGSYGDKQVLLSSLEPDVVNDTYILFFHGVHSSANFSHGNKYRWLAYSFAKLGYTPFLCETSRKTRDIAAFENDSLSWIMSAFEGKTFADELADCKIAFDYVANLAHEKSKKMWLCGFSLGGIIAYVISTTANEIDHLILCGSGAYAFPPVEKIQSNLPITRDLLNVTDSPFSTSHPNFATALWGEFDDIFPKDACEKLFSFVEPKHTKNFFVINGANHSLKLRNGVLDRSLTKEITDKIVSISK